MLLRYYYLISFVFITLNIEVETSLRCMVLNE